MENTKNGFLEWSAKCSSLNYVRKNLLYISFEILKPFELDAHETVSDSEHGLWTRHKSPYSTCLLVNSWHLPQTVGQILNAIKFLIHNLRINIWHRRSFTSLCIFYNIYYNLEVIWNIPCISDNFSLHHPPCSAKNAVNSNSLGFCFVRFNAT